MALSRLFGIARSSLFAHQQALSVTSTNLANVNNPAYSRQVAIFGTTVPDYRSKFSFGSGVAVEQVNRIRNEIVDKNIRTNNHKYFNAEKRHQEMSHIESILSEGTDSGEFGLANLFNKFFNSWEELAADPESSASRTEVIDAAQSLTSKFATIHEGIREKKGDLKNEARDMVTHINTTLQELQNVNKDLYEFSVIGNNVNDLLDTRDQLLEDLSEYVDFQVNIDKNNVATVSIGGMFAVDGSSRTEFEIQTDNNKLSLGQKDSDGSAHIYGGKLNAVFEMYNDEIPKQLEKLDSIANTFMEKVNEIHKKGFTITDPAENEIEFFTSYDTGIFEINDKILKDNKYLAISEDGNAGDNSLALEIAQLKNEKLLDGKTIAENYSDFVTDIGSEVRLQNQNMESSGSVLTQLHNTKIATSSVSTDEEIMNVMKYQRSYDAAAKLITVADELLQTILTMV